MNWEIHGDLSPRKNELWSRKLIQRTAIQELIEEWQKEWMVNSSRNAQNFSSITIKLPGIEQTQRIWICLNRVKGKP